MTTPDIHRTIDAAWRIESARLIASLTRLVRDVGLAEDLAQGALVAALEQWPQSGIPDKPGAWLMVTAKHHAIDQIRRNVRLDNVGFDAYSPEWPEVDASDIFPGRNFSRTEYDAEQLRLERVVDEH